MTRVNVRRLLRGLAMAAGGAGALLVGTREARACGGCFVPPPPPQVVQSESVITDEKMILSISMDQTTLYDEITYSGSPATFAWVLPIKGIVDVGLSADIMFQTINQLTTTTVTQPPSNCPPAPTCGGGGVGCGASTDSASAGFGANFPAGTAAGGDAASESKVTVISQMQVGPYEEVQLKSDDGSALTAWLTQHGYDIPDYTKPVIAAYVADKFDFLALKLVPGEGVQSMQPVRVTSKGAAPSLPLHMVAVGTGPVTGITIWIVADARWEPSNFPTFTIAPSELAWNWLDNSSNYETLRLAKEAALGGRGWQIESSLELSQYTIQQQLLDNVEYDTNQVGGYPQALAVGVDAGGTLGQPDAGGRDGGQRDAGPSATTDAGSVTAEAGSADAGDDAEEGFEADSGYVYPNSAATEFATQDLGVLFAGIAPPNVRITRMRSDVAKSALSVDMHLEASKDQSELSNEIVPTQEIGEPACPVYNSNCVQTGIAPRSQASTSSSGSSCSTTSPRNEVGTTVAFLLGLGGVAAVRSRKKRRR